MSVTLTSDQVAFANQVAAATGLSPQVVEAWEAQEGNPSGSTGSYNFLNITTAHGQGVVVPSSGLTFANYSSLADAVSASVSLINKLGIAKAASGQAPAGQIAAIAASPWDGTGHYGGAGGPNLLNTYKSVTGGVALTAAGTAAAGQATQPAQNAPSQSDCLWQLNLPGSSLPVIGGALQGCVLSRAAGETWKGALCFVGAGILTLFAVKTLTQSDPTAAITKAFKGSFRPTESGQPLGANGPSDADYAKQKADYDAEMASRGPNDLADRRQGKREASVAGKLAKDGAKVATVGAAAA